MEYLKYKVQLKVQNNLPRIKDRIYTDAHGCECYSSIIFFIRVHLCPSVANLKICAGT